jgi:hypothetical protein
MRKDIPPEVLVYMEQMLKRRVTVEEAIAIMAPFDAPPKTKKGQRTKAPILSTSNPPGEGPHARSIRELAEEMLPGDELWEYGTSDEVWQNLQGEMGFAIVRAGKVIRFDMHIMN